MTSAVHGATECESGRYAGARGNKYIYRHRSRDSLNFIAAQIVGAVLALLLFN
jgi:hypothetical protein